eukprot:459266_1
MITMLPLQEQQNQYQMMSTYGHIQPQQSLSYTYSVPQQQQQQSMQLMQQQIPQQQRQQLQQLQPLENTNINNNYQEASYQNNNGQQQQLETADANPFSVQIKE